MEEVLRGPDGAEVHWRSRRYRKGRDAITLAMQGRLGRAEPVWGAPHRLGWWMGVLFAIGSACFAIASLPDASGALGVAGVGITYFVGSVFFTSAAYLQLLQAVNVERGPGQVEPIRLLRLEPRRIDWWAADIQLVGTLLFNVNTFDAMIHRLGPGAQDVLVWAPDMAGSACFLVASALSVIEIGGAALRLPRAYEWWIVWVNMLGSVAFGISAVDAYVAPDSGLELSAVGATTWTLVGAVCFLVGALLLLPEAEAAEGETAQNMALMRPAAAPG